MPDGNRAGRYVAFISWSHRGDRCVGPAAKAALERFPAPWYRGRRRMVYLDRGDLAALPDLRRALLEALTDSEHLVLVASPE